MTKHTKEWWEGYNSSGPRSRNPYQGDPKIADKSMNWLDGWLCKFFGETP